MTMDIRKSTMGIRRSSLPITWVVYRMTLHKQTDRTCAVCMQSEWDAMELARPGYHRLVRGGIATEVEAELLARQTPTAKTET